MYTYVCDRFALIIMEKQSFMRYGKKTMISIDNNPQQQTQAHTFIQQNVELYLNICI